MLDIDIDPAWTSKCTEPGWEGTGPFVPLFADAATLKTDGSLGGEWWYGAGGTAGSTNDPIRLILLDIGGGDTVIDLDRQSRPIR